MARRQRRPMRAAVQVRCVRWARSMVLLLAAWALSGAPAWAQQIEQPERLMLDRELLTDGHVDLAKLLLSPTHLRGPPLASFVEVWPAPMSRGKAWMRTSKGCLVGHLRQGALSVRIDNACEVQVLVDGPFALLRCHDQVVAQLDLQGRHPVQVDAGLAWVPTTRLVADAARQTTVERVCTPESLKERSANTANYTVVDGIIVTTPQRATPPDLLDWTPTPEDCTEPPLTGDVRLLQQARLDLIGRRWPSRTPQGLQIFPDQSSCEGATLAATHTSHIATTRTYP